jgi:ribonuclease P protein component
VPGELRTLRRRAEFRRIYASGLKVVGRYLVLFALPDCLPSRLGITTTRRLGGAVVRNRARRRVRELARRDWEAIAVLTAGVVVNVRQAAVAASWPELEEDFRKCLSRVAHRVRQRDSSSVC